MGNETVQNHGRRADSVLIVIANCKGWSAHLFPAASIYSHSLPVLISHNLAYNGGSLRADEWRVLDKLPAIQAWSYTGLRVPSNVTVSSDKIVYKLNFSTDFFLFLIIEGIKILYISLKIILKLVFFQDLWQYYIKMQAENRGRITRKFRRIICGDTTMVDRKGRG